MTNQPDSRNYVLKKASENKWVFEFDNKLRNEVSQEYGKDFLFRVDATLKELDKQDFLNKRRSGNIYDVTSKGQSIHKDGGFTHQEDVAKERVQIELDLAKSNIEANRLNKENYRFNRIATIINIIIGALNIGLILWQIKQ